MFYFEHSSTAATDPKIMDLRLQHGGAAIDAYWYLVERMHHDESWICVSNANALRVVCHALCTTQEELLKWVDAMVEVGLFCYDETGEFIYSERADENIKAYEEKREKARSAAESRWGKKGNADAMQTQCDSNANKTKIKTKINNKDKEINKESSVESDFTDEVISYLNDKAGTSYRPSSKQTQTLIRARIKEGFTLNDFKAVIDGRVSAWGKDPKMVDYLRPQTLFGTKFESYLNAPTVKVVSADDYSEYA